MDPLWPLGPGPDRTLNGGEVPGRYLWSQEKETVPPPAKRREGKKTKKKTASKEKKRTEKRERHRRERPQEVVTAGADDTARLWNASTGAELRSLEGHSGDVSQRSASAQRTVQTANQSRYSRASALHVSKRELADRTV